MSKRVAVLKGGMSPERDVSLVSGRECAKALRAEGYTVIEIDVAPNLWEQLHDADPDVDLMLCTGNGVRTDAFKACWICSALPIRIAV